ncbi:hypothetical protein BDV96DRAFT_692313 [Lophiotrema nucula]|uniref:Actin-like ATPase domain-containing protein n=1 Tax=Lophiotrema nucula TaxID=690887 RepID=A0A6A5YPD1_9PLEO|nr:hypothetical protein BDV96DRAFT_692313 [Lophiotrema nucula]
MFRRAPAFGPVLDDLYMIIAIDFGTTYTGVSWTWSGRLREVDPITKWPRNASESLGTESSAKVPSRIQYNGRKPTAWGFGLDNGEDTYEWFKLLLDYENLPPEIKASDRVKYTYRKLKMWATTYSNGDALAAAVKFTSDYLRLVWSHALSVIRDQKGQTWTDGVPCKIIVSRPAIWTQLGSDRTKIAVEEAIRKSAHRCSEIEITMISEPEAAAQTMLQSPTITLRPDLTRPGDIYLICDAGGGTVDVISYELQSLQPLKLSECVEGKGDLCGAVFIDEAFDRDIRVRIGGTQEWAKLNDRQIRRIMDQWEFGIKRLFNTMSEYWIDIPGSRSELYEPGHVVGLFQHPCSRARALVQQQVEQVRQTCQRPPKAIILVGGMGASDYLAALLKEQYKNEIEIRHSNPESWNAVCKGAVMSIVENHTTVVSRISRLHYGFPFDAEYDPNDPGNFGRPRYWDHHRQLSLVEGKMRWLVHKGERVAHITQKRGLFRHRIDVGENITASHILISIHVCKESIAPDWQDASVEPLCDLIVKLDDNFAYLPTFTTPSRNLYRFVTTEVAMTPRGHSLDFEIFVENRPLEHAIRWPDGSIIGQSLAIDMDAQDVVLGETKDHARDLDI